MKVALIASSDRDLYASALLEKLVADGNIPDCIFCAEEPKLRQIRNYLRANGLLATIAKILDSLGLKESGTNETRRYIKQYAEKQRMNFNESVSSTCDAHDVPFISVPSMNASEAVTRVKNRDIDLLLTTGGEILRKSIIQSVTIGIFNAHSALLPQYRGFNVMEWSLFCGTPIGVSLHFIDMSIDTGDIIEFREVPIQAGDTIASLRGKYFPVMVDVMSTGVSALVSGSLERQTQLPEDGKQFFAMHPRLRSVVEARLAARTQGE